MVLAPTCHSKLSLLLSVVLLSLQTSKAPPLLRGISFPSPQTHMILAMIPDLLHQEEGNKPCDTDMKGPHDHPNHCKRGAERANNTEVEKMKCLKCSGDEGLQ